MKLYHQIASLAITLLLLLGTTGVPAQDITLTVNPIHSGGYTIGPLSVIR